MFKKSKKKLSVLLVLAMVMTMLTGLAAPAAAANTALTIPNITTGSTRTLGTIRINETTKGSIVPGTQIIIDLPSGVRWQAAPTPATLVNYVYVPSTVPGTTTLNGLLPSDVTILPGATTASMTLNIASVTGGVGIGVIELRFNATGSTVDVTAGAGDVNVNIFESTGAIRSGLVTNARIVTGATSATALAAPSVTRAGSQTLGSIRIIETAPGSLAVGANSISIALPNDMVFVGPASVTVAGGFAAAGAVVPGTVDTNAMGRSRVNLNVETPSLGQPGIITVSGLVANIGTDAALGDINVTVGGGNPGISAATLRVGVVTELGVVVSAKTAAELIAGRPDAAPADVVLTEGAAGSLIGGRTVTLTLPEGAVWRTAPDATVAAGAMSGWTVPAVSNRSRTLTYTVPAFSTRAATVEFRDGSIDVRANVAGDLRVTVGGTGGASGDVVVATVSAPVTASAQVRTLGIGTMNQPVGDITIVESRAGVIVANPGLGAGAGQIIVMTPFDGMVWSGTPTVTVTAGNLRINTAGITANGSRSLVIPITTSSTTASTITVTNARVTLDRTVPYGAQNFGIRGAAVDWTGNVTAVPLSLLPADLLRPADVATVVAGTTATPAPTDLTQTSVFTIGALSFVRGGVTTAIDAAPSIVEGRTMLPLRFAALAVGVSEDNILWDPVRRTVTLIGDRVVQLQIGSTSMLINGVAVPIDVAPSIVNGRTMLPIRALVQALRADIVWDGTARTVTVTAR